jgi:hypothetical protein
VISKDTKCAPPREDDAELPARLADPPEEADDASEHGRVEEGDLRQVEQHADVIRLGALVGVGEQLPEPRRVVRVELTGQGHDDRAALRSVECAAHLHPIMPGAPMRRPWHHCSSRSGLHDVPRARGRRSRAVRAGPAPARPEDERDEGPPAAPTTIRMMPTVSRSTPDTVAVTAQVRIARSRSTEGLRRYPLVNPSLQLVRSPTQCSPRAAPTGYPLPVRETAPRGHDENGVPAAHRLSPRPG